MNIIFTYIFFLIALVIVGFLIYRQNTIFTRFLTFLGGANNSILFAPNAELETERGKFVAIGIGVLNTAILATIAMLFAMNAIFVEPYEALKVEALQQKRAFLMPAPDLRVLIGFSVFWGFIIFGIDWGLIKTMKKVQNMWTLRNVGPVVFRILIAIIISYSVSRPMEVQIFKTKLQFQIKKDRLNEVNNERAKNQAAKTDSIKKDIDKTDTKKKDHDEAIAKGPQSDAYKSNAKQDSVCRKELETLHSNYDGKIIQNNNERAAIKNNGESYNWTRTPEGKLKRGGMKANATNRRAKLQQEIDRMESELAEKSKECGIYSTAKTNEETAFNENMAATSKVYAERLASENKERQRLDSIANREYWELDSVSRISYTPNLISYIGAMSNYEKTPEGAAAFWVRLVLLLLIIAVDTAPIVIKFLAPYGPYESAMVNLENRLQYLAAEEQAMNEELITLMANSQRNVLREAAKQFEQEEIRRLRENPNHYQNYINGENNTTTEIDNQGNHYRNRRNNNQEEDTILE